jgi:hypothetical protein
LKDRPEDIIQNAADRVEEIEIIKEKLRDI